MDKLPSWTLFRALPESVVFTRSGHVAAAPRVVSFARKEAAQGTPVTHQVNRYTVKFNIGHLGADNVPLAARDSVSLEVSHALAASTAAVEAAIDELAAMIVTPEFKAMILTQLTLPRDV